MGIVTKPSPAFTCNSTVPGARTAPQEASNVTAIVVPPAGSIMSGRPDG